MYICTHAFHMISLDWSTGTVQRNPACFMGRTMISGRFCEPNLPAWAKDGVPQAFATQGETSFFSGEELTEQHQTIYIFYPVIRGLRSVWGTFIPYIFPIQWGAGWNYLEFSQPSNSI